MLQYFLLKATILLCHFHSYTQPCPPNIDFENGTFDNWTCHTGFVYLNNGENETSLAPVSGPVTNRHVMFSSAQRNIRDKYGRFPVVCPNGSGYSIRLGNEVAGGQAEAVSYEFTIPAGQNTYSLIYHYAVVFLDPVHNSPEQPRLAIEVTNVTDNEPIECSSFTFIPVGTALPGFFESPIKVGQLSVWCKDWSAVSVNLNGMAGKKIRLLFKTADCVFQEHWGYAYIDVNTECSSEFIGAGYCPADTIAKVTAPFGYYQYNWYSSNFSQLLGTEQSIILRPPPPSGTTLAVEVIPYDGYGCRDTLYALLVDTLSVRSYAGRDTLSCNEGFVPIGTNSKPGLVYSWSPAAGLSDPRVANPLASPDTPTRYVVTTSSPGGGCIAVDTVFVDVSVIDSSLLLTGKEAFCFNSNDSAVLSVQQVQSIQWYRNNSAISAATGTVYKVTQSGDYHCLLINDKGCKSNTSTTNISIEIPVPGTRYPTVNAVMNKPVQLEARNIGPGVEWIPATSLSDARSPNPVFNGSTQKEFIITMETANGCMTIDTQLVKVFKEISFYVPTAFTPNNDGLNDFLKPLQAGIKELRYFRIYNRWGQLVFDLQSDSKGWDGRLNGIPQSSQLFAWVAEGIGVDDLVYTQKGTCLLVR